MPVTTTRRLPFPLLTLPPQIPNLRKQIRDRDNP